MAPLKIRFSKRALDQLYAILDFIALDNPDAAERIAERAEELVAQISTFPELEPKVFPTLPHRELKPYPLRIIYHTNGGTIWVVAVLRQEQLVRPESLDTPCLKRAAGAPTRGPASGIIDCARSTELDLSKSILQKKQSQ